MEGTETVSHKSYTGPELPPSVVREAQGAAPSTPGAPHRRSAFTTIVKHSALLKIFGFLSGFKLKGVFHRDYVTEIPQLNAPLPWAHLKTVAKSLAFFLLFVFIKLGVVKKYFLQ